MIYILDAIQYCIWKFPKFLEIYKLDHACFLTAPGLKKKKTEVKLELLMVETSIRRGIYHALHRYVKVNNKYMKDCDKKKEPYLSIGT